MLRKEIGGLDKQVHMKGVMWNTGQCSSSMNADTCASEKWGCIPCWCDISDTAVLWKWTCREMEVRTDHVGTNSSHTHTQMHF